MAEVEVGLTTVVGDVDLAVLEGVHRPRVDVDVRVELLHRDPKTTGFEQATERRSGDALAEGAGHPTRHEDVLRHGVWTLPHRGPEPADGGVGGRGRVAVGLTGDELEAAVRADLERLRDVMEDTVGDQS